MWDRRLDALLENYLGEELCVSRPLNKSNQFTLGTAQGDS